MKLLLTYYSKNPMMIIEKAKRKISEATTQLGKVKVQRINFDDVDSYMGAIQHCETAMTLNSLKEIREHTKHARSLICDISYLDLNPDECQALDEAHNYLGIAKDLINDYFESITDL